MYMVGKLGNLEAEVERFDANMGYRELLPQISSKMLLLISRMDSDLRDKR